MRLTAIKLAGFKSFVDPTTLFIPSNLTGVVGPNGCGKSNIIDGVRWVMGEGSAKVLRGESMADVIFSGSSSRKPVGTATVELIFDNSDGRVSGEYAGYNEISVKRQVSRDGISSYFLNSSRCRRKDITDLFLGTGIGARSYSIIEQGMISRIVEARPEEIRAHLEEAAGISKYRERRRETENRIRHTRDNLARLFDLREEVSKHLAKLKRQARAAERYKDYKKQARALESRLLALRWQELVNKAESSQQALKKMELAQEGQVAEQRSAEADLESLREQQAAASEAFSKVQGELYEVGGEVARLEQTIQHERELQTRQQEEFKETESSLNELEKHIILDRAHVDELTVSLAAIEPDLDQALAAEQAAQQHAEEAENSVRSWQLRFDEHHQKDSGQARMADVEKTRLEHLDHRILENAEQLRQLEGQLSEQGEEALTSRLGSAEQAMTKARETVDSLRKKLQSTSNRLHDKREELEQIRQQRDASLSQQHSQEGRLESLHALHQAAIGADNQSARQWLQKSGLAKAQRLAEKLVVKKQWIVAVEMALEHWLDGLLLEDPGSHAESLAKLENGRLALLSSGGNKVKARSGSLAEKVSAPDVVIEQLNTVQCAADAGKAWQAVAGLKPGQSVMTPQGEWFGKGWIRINRNTDAEANILSRKQEIQKLEEQNKDGQAGLKKLKKALSAAQQQIGKLDAEQQSVQQEFNLQDRELAKISKQVEHQREKLTENEKRQQAVQQRQQQLTQQLADDRKSVKKARKALQGLLDSMAGLQDQRKQLETERRALLETRDKTRAMLAESRERRHQLALKNESNRASLDSLQASVGRMDNQLSQLQNRYVQLSEQLAKASKPDQAHQPAMSGLLDKRGAIEQRLTAARTGVQSLEDQYRKRDGERQQTLRSIELERADLEQSRLRLQEIQLKARALEERLSEMDQDVAELASSLEKDADVADWQQQLEKLQQRIIRLEPVNLAAIQEFDEESERKEYLDAQNEDLTKALTTLEAAIEKIDRKTRTRFKDTFERVNKGVEELFPQLFGGGHAYLELTGEDLLTTGVSIMARPPGKRISSIHLLSGGEKALTAVAFVFAIFGLNPSPFCLLDEVDAPLDDANVERFASMVQEMANEVQFLIVTHNKITMEMVRQLSGVTMREPGVSRLVSVDIDEAARMAAS